MIIAIVKYDSKQTIQTMTQIYIAFMDATILYYKESLPKWNTISLRQCILNRGPMKGHVHTGDLCDAFQTLHNVAFEMIFKHKSKFPDYIEIQNNIRNLGFVSIDKEYDNWEPDQIRYTFRHPTFLEFFAALHLTTLTHDKQIDYITLSVSYTHLTLPTIYSV